MKPNWFTVDVINKNGQGFMQIPLDSFRPMLIVVDEDAAVTGHDFVFATPISDINDKNEIDNALNEGEFDKNITTWLVD